MPFTQVTSIANMKGGVGKSTITGMLGMSCYYYYQKKPVLFIDSDPQGNLSHTLRLSPEKGSLYDVLSGKKTIKEVLNPIKFGFAISSSPELASADVNFSTKIGKEYLLRDYLNELENDFSVCVIDTPPSAGVLTVNALTASTDVVIPAQADMYSIQGITQIFSCIEAIKKYCNVNLTVSGILLTRFKKNTTLSQEIAKNIGEMAEKYGTKAFETRIRESIVVKEAQANQMLLWQYDSKADVSKDFYEWSKEYFEDKNGKEKI